MQDGPEEKALERILQSWKLKEFEKVTPSNIFEIYKAMLHKKNDWKRLEASAGKKIQSNIEIARTNSEKFNKFIKDFITYDQKQHYQMQLKSPESDEKKVAHCRLIITVHKQTVKQTAWPWKPLLCYQNMPCSKCITQYVEHKMLAKYVICNLTHKMPGLVPSSIQFYQPISAS